MNDRPCSAWMIIVLLVCGAVGTVSAQATETHTVQAGETLYRIATEYGVSVDELRQANGLEGNTIQVGQELIIPATDGEEPSEEESPPEEPPEDEPSPEDPPHRESPENESPEGGTDGTHRVDVGETLYSIAARYDISVDSLLAANQPLNPGRSLREGSELVLPRQFQTTTYTVRSGNTLGSIARKFGVSVNAVRRENNITGDKIQVGQVLQIPSRAVPEPGPRGSLGPVDTTGVVQTYPNTFAGRLTASGEPYDPEAFTASHPSLPFGSVLLLTHPTADRSTFVRITDRGPVEPDVLVDISRAAAQVLGVSDTSDTSINVRRIK